MFNVRLLGLVEMDLEDSGSVEPHSDPLADNLGGVDEVVEDRVVYGEKGARPRPLLLQLVGLSRRLGEDASLGDEDDVLAAELLLQFTDQTSLERIKTLLKTHNS